MGMKKIRLCGTMLHYMYHKKNALVPANKRKNGFVVNRLKKQKNYVLI